MEIEIPQEVVDQMEKGERIVGYTKTLFDSTVIMTKKGCSTKDGCTNYMYHSALKFKRTELSDVESSTVTMSEVLFLKSFIW